MSRRGQCVGRSPLVQLRQRSVNDDGLAEQCSLPAACRQHAASARR